MKTEKMSFKNIKDVLSREEMKEIMAGSSVSPSEYCATNAAIMRYCFNIGDTACMAAAGAAWRANC